MQRAHQEQQQAADAYDMKISRVHLDVDTLDIACVHSISQQQLAAIDEHRSNQQLTAIEAEAAAAIAAAEAATAAPAAGAAAAPAAAAVPYWDVVHVYVEGTWHATVTAEGSVTEVSVPKSGHWVLCRGPLLVNKAVPADADKPWFMLAWL